MQPLEESQSQLGLGFILGSTDPGVPPMPSTVPPLGVGLIVPSTWSVVCLVVSTIIKHVSGLDLSFDEMQKVGVHSFFKILTRGYALLILEREEGRDRERINVREISCLPYAPQLGVEPTT